MIRVLIVGADAMVRRGLRMRLALESDMVVPGEAGDVASAVPLALRARPDVILMDLQLPGTDGVIAAGQLLRDCRGATLVALSNADDAVTRLEAAVVGAVALVGKVERDDRLLETIRMVAARRAEAPETGGGSVIPAFVGSARSQATSPASATPTTIGGCAAPPASHLCTFYGSEAGRLQLAVPFLRDGLRLGQTCFLVAAVRAQGLFFRALWEAGVDVDAAVGTQRLVASAGFSSARDGVAFFERSFGRALRSGRTPMRVVGEPAEALEGSPLTELLTLEAGYDSLAEALPLVSLCQYDTRRFDGLDRLQALRIHGDMFDHRLRHCLS